MRNLYKLKFLKWVFPVAVLIIVFYIIYKVALQGPILSFLPYKFNAGSQNNSPSPSQRSPVSLAPSQKKEGWNSQLENQFMNMCPSAIKLFKPDLCTCILTKVEQNYTSSQAQQMLNEYQQTKQIPPQMQPILSECNS